MQKIEFNPTNFFKVLKSTARSQAAEMVLSPGQSTGGASNHHRDSDQWLFVLSGSGKAIIEEEEVSLEKHTLLLIEAEENHEIINDGEENLKTLNIYAPKEY